MCVLIGVLFSSAYIAGSDTGNTVPGSAVFVDVVFGELKVDSVSCRIGDVIQSLRGYRGL